MTNYFDVTLDTDLALVPSSYRQATNLALLASEAESDILAYYTTLLEPASFAPLSQLLEWGQLWVVPSPVGQYVSLLDGRGVFLNQYTVDASLCASVALKLAMRKTIARVLVWRLNQETRDTSTQLESVVGRTFKNYVADHDAPFPRHWDRDLRQFDTRIPAWGV